MFTFDRETALLVTVAVCVIASIYMYRELRRSKDDITQIKDVLDRAAEEDEMYTEQEESEMHAPSANVDDAGQGANTSFDPQDQPMMSMGTMPMPTPGQLSPQ